jgi:hypothetical protein
LVDPGRVLVDLAVAIADGAEAISDIAVLADRPVLTKITRRALCHTRLPVGTTTVTS